MIGWGQGWYEAPPRPWYALGVGPITVWHIAGQEALAKSVGQWGADAYRELTTLLEFQPEARLVLRLYPTPQAYAQVPIARPKGMLVPPPAYASVYPHPSRSALAAQVRSEVFALILLQLYFAEGVRVQNRSLLYLPDWYFWGFCYFWGEGWQGEDLARLQSIPPQAFTEITRRTVSPSPFYKSLYKSIWFYLYRTYGQRKVIDFLYMTRLTRNIDEALYLTFNLHLYEMQEKWRQFLDNLRLPYTPSVEDEIERRALLAAAVAPNGEERAFATLQKGRVSYFLRSGEGKVYPLPGSWIWRAGYVEPPLSMSFSPQGNLVWTAYQREQLILWRWNRAERTYERYPLSLLAVQGFSWDEEKLLFAGLSIDGKVRLYEMAFPQGKVRVIGEAEGDLLYPQRHQGKLYALWQPDTSRLSPLTLPWEPRRPVRQTPEGWVSLPYPPFYSVEGGWIVHDTALTTLSDVIGSSHPWTFTSDTSYPSQWQYGLVQTWAGASNQQVFFLRYRLGKLRLAQAPWRSLLEEGKIFPPIHAAEVVQTRLQRRAALYAAYRSPSPLSLSPSDTSKTDTARSKRAPFYLFDEEVTRPLRRRTYRKHTPSASERGEQLPSATPLGAVPYQWELWELRLEPVLHPLVRFGWQIQGAVRDWHGDHEWQFLWRPYIDLRSSELHLRYTRYRSRWQPVADLYKQSHFFPARRFERTLRITTWQGSLGLRYPFTAHLGGEIYGVLISAHRYDIGRSTENNLSLRTLAPGLRISLNYDALTHREGFTWEGWLLHLRGEAFYRNKNWLYPLAALHIERFQPIFNKIVLEWNGIAAAGGAIGRYFLLGGAPQWINYDFQNRSQVPLLLEPMGYFLTEYVSLPGFPYQARRGRNLLLTSITAHLPLLAWRNDLSLPVRPIYNFDWYFSYYIGTTWTTGNPFSQKNPIDTEFIFRPPLVISVQTLKSPFLISFGTGISFQVMRLPLTAALYWPVEEARVGKVSFIAGIHRNL